MENYKGLDFETFTTKDVNILTPVMKRAFDEDSRRHLDKPEGGPDGYDNGDFLRKYALNPKSKAYKISRDGRPVGAVIVWVNPDRINYLGNIFIDPDLQDKGFGTAVWEYIEIKYPETVIWRTETPGFSKRNHNFYVNKCGFSIVRIVNPGNKYEELYQLQKVMKLQKGKE